MRLAVVSDRVPPGHLGGAEVVAHVLARQYARLGHDVTIIANAPASQRDGDIKILGLNRPPAWTARATYGAFDVGTTAALSSALTAVRPDAIHMHNIHGYFSFAALLTARRLGVPISLTYHDCMAFTGWKYVPPGAASRASTQRTPARRPGRALASRVFWQLRNAFVRSCLAGGIQTCAVSNALADCLRAHRVPCQQTVHNGVDLERFMTRPLHPAVAELKSAGRSIVLFVGRITDLKGVDQLLGAMAIVGRRAPRATLVFLGASAEQLRFLSERATQSAMKSNITGTGWLPYESVAAVYSGADVVCVPSIYLDPFPNTVLEAMACARPVVATVHGGAKEAVVDGVTGRIVDPLSTDALADALLDLLEDRRRAEAMGRAGRQRVESCFQIEPQARRYLEMLASAHA